MTELDGILQNPLSRRSFLSRMSAAGLGAAAVALLAGCGGSGGNASGGGIANNTAFADQAHFPGIPGSSENTVVLNFALTLEIAEADLYRQAINIAAGKPVSTPAPANNNYSSYSLAISAGGLSSQNAAIAFLYLQQYAAVEAAHRDFLKTALGSAAVPANAKGYTANFGTTMESIMSLLRIVEETGVTAYLGAAGFITNPVYTQIASTIYTTEARHSAAINYILGDDIGPSGVAGGAQPASGAANEFEYAQTPAAVLAAVKPFFVS